MVIDTCLFLNENDVFALRYDILFPVVDEFLVIEADTTLQGHFKGYVFEHADLPKVRHVKIQYPQLGSGDTIAMEREWYTRDLITDYLMCEESDWVLLSDVDEIPNPDVLESHVDRWSEYESIHVFAFEQYLSYYYANLRATDFWYGTKMAQRRAFNRVGDMRRVTKDNCIVLGNGGWHMSYLGSAKQRQYKLASFGHANAVQHAAPYIEQAAKSGVDYLGRSDMQFNLIAPDDPTLPHIILEYPAFIYGVDGTII